MAAEGGYPVSKLFIRSRVTPHEQIAVDQDSGRRVEVGKS